MAALAVLMGLVACGGGGSTAPESSGTQRLSPAALTHATPQTGVWWDPSASGKGYGIEVQGTQLSLTVYQYAASGQATWYAGVLAQQPDGSYAGSIGEFVGGQSLAGTYKAPTGSNTVGTASLSFSTPTAGTLVTQISTPTATVPNTIAIQRFSFSSPAFSPASSSLQSGVWWAPSQSGRGYFIESQGNQVSIGSYMYDEAGKPVWYTGMATLQSNGVTAVSSLLQFANGQTLTGAYQAPVLLTGTLGNMTFVVTSTTTANLTLPSGNTVALTRFAFGDTSAVATAPSLTLLKAPEFSPGDDSVLAMPYTGDDAAVFSLTCSSSRCSKVYDAATFRLRASGKGYTITNLSAVNTTAGSGVVPTFSGVTNGQVIADGETATFVLQSPFTLGATVNLVYSFLVLETGQTFSYKLRLTTN